VAQHTDDEPQSVPCDITQLKECCDHNHRSQELSDAVPACDAGDSNHNQRQCDGRNNNKEREAQSERRSDKNADYRKDQNNTPPATVTPVPCGVTPAQDWPFCPSKPDGV
jgi:hypothetical protein